MPEKYIVKLTQQADENLREIADDIRFKRIMIKNITIVNLSSGTI